MFGRKKIHIMLIGGILLLSLVIAVTSFESTNDNLKSNLITIEREQLLSMIDDSEKEAFVYVGRPSCIDCEVFYPELINILKENKTSIFYFDTTTKASKKPEMKSLMQSFGIEQIPAIMHIKDGEIFQLYDCQMDEEIKQFTFDLQKKERK